MVKNNNESFKDISSVVVVVSDSVACGKREDLSGEVLIKLLKDKGSSVLSKEVVPDEQARIEDRLKALCDNSKVKLILSTGGTGLGKRDVTPEATRNVIQKEVPGISELARGKGAENTDRAWLSRGTSGVRGKTLIINMPGSPKGAKESFEAVCDIIPHALDMIQGKGHDD